MMGEIVTRNI